MTDETKIEDLSLAHSDALDAAEDFARLGLTAHAEEARTFAREIARSLASITVTKCQVSP